MCKTTQLYCLLSIIYWQACVYFRTRWDWELFAHDPNFRADSWLPQYKRKIGVLVDTSNFEPVNYFKLFFPDSIFSLTATQSNQYLDQMKELPNLPADSRLQTAEQTSDKEQQAYVALQIAMGLCSKPALADYWSGYWLTKVQFGEVMSRIRIEILNQILHLCDNSKGVPHGQEGYNPLYKVHDLLKETESLYAKAYCPSKELSLDKSMIKFKGRIFFKQFNPSKPTRWGIRQFALYEAKTCYALKFLTYSGATTLSTTDTHLTATENIVQEMMADYAGHGHVLYTDSFYTSPNIVRALKAKQIGYCGTVRAGRKETPEILHPNHLQLRKGAEPAFAKCKNSSIVACTWHDVKWMFFLSSVYGAEQVSKEGSKKHEGGFRRIQKLLLAEGYNQYMGGVDTMDQLLGTYCFLHKQTKW